MSTTSAERPPNTLLSHNQLARAARAAIAALVSAACLASPVAGGGFRGPARDRAGLSEIARDVLRRDAIGRAHSADEPAIPAARDREEPAVAPAEPHETVPAADLLPAVQGTTVAIPPGAKPVMGSGPGLVPERRA